MVWQQVNDPMESMMCSMMLTAISVAIVLMVL